MNQLVCPQCGKKVQFLRRFPVVWVTALPPGSLKASAICDTCWQQLAQKVAQNPRYKASFERYFELKEVLWKKRQLVVKKAYFYLKAKDATRAAMNFEQYLKIVEFYFDTTLSDLTPWHLKAASASEEITLLTSVFWDMMKLYDNHPLYQNRLQALAQKLIEFAPFTPLVVSLLKEIETLLPKSQHPDLWKQVQQRLKRRSGACLIASYFLDPQDPALWGLRLWRNHFWLEYSYTRVFVAWYYRQLGPWLLSWLPKRKWLNYGVKCSLRWLGLLWWYWFVKQLIKRCRFDETHSIYG